MSEKVQSVKVQSKEEFLDINLHCTSIVELEHKMKLANSFFYHEVELMNMQLTS